MARPPVPTAGQLPLSGVPVRFPPYVGPCVIRHLSERRLSAVTESEPASVSAAQLAVAAARRTTEKQLVAAIRPSTVARTGLPGGQGSALKLQLVVAGDLGCAAVSACCRRRAPTPPLV